MVTMGLWCLELIQALCVRYVTHGIMQNAKVYPMKHYAVLQGNEAMHWYCRGCNKGMARLQQTIYAF